jgi:hypothetical protein
VPGAAFLALPDKPSGSSPRWDRNQSLNRARSVRKSVQHLQDKLLVSASIEITCLHH